MRRIIILSFLVSFLCVSCLIQNPKKEDCDVKQITVSRVYEGGDKDIVFAEYNGGIYYINRGLEQGYTIEGVRKKVLNKNVTLHLASTLIGSSSNHIAQITVGDEILFTEFN
ncbi:hypothetical protein GCM10011344_14220 [Dokdonia pacifica]|uniref:Uncharacterized protein n=1 Tax=Dokdonia pacifica TaxID=1627892 RepID=A0A238W6X6_9FLAO|nr:hypothetical protein [Dokdonia pacifica]GGG14733.1 hypothetical protein GCM10011344_14220 [Dokdonia pacifica]SNR41943.1 hypothetical protein SAMN06265376_101723 [Dokdonia pacifica]